MKLGSEDFQVFTRYIRMIVLGVPGLSVSLCMCGFSLGTPASIQKHACLVNW